MPIKDRRQQFLIVFSLAAVFVLALWIFLRHAPPAATLSNVIEPSQTEPLMDFTCDPLLCEIIGQKANAAGQLLETKIYNPTISNGQVGGFSTAAFVANQGDILMFNFTNKDKPVYYFFIPRLNLAYESSNINSFPWIIRTTDLAPGDYPVMLQDSLDPNVAVLNFRAAVIRVQ